MCLPLYLLLQLHLPPASPEIYDESLTICNYISSWPPNTTYRCSPTHGCSRCPLTFTQCRVNTYPEEVCEICLKTGYAKTQMNRKNPAIIRCSFLDSASSSIVVMRQQDLAHCSHITLGLDNQRQHKVASIMIDSRQEHVLFRAHTDLLFQCDKTIEQAGLEASTVVPTDLYMLSLVMDCTCNHTITSGIQDCKEKDLLYPKYQQKWAAETIQSIRASEVYGCSMFYKRCHIIRSDDLTADRWCDACVSDDAIDVLEVSNHCLDHDINGTQIKVLATVTVKPASGTAEAINESVLIIILAFIIAWLLNTLSFGLNGSDK